MKRHLISLATGLLLLWVAPLAFSQQSSNEGNSVITPPASTDGAVTPIALASAPVRATAADATELNEVPPAAPMDEAIAPSDGSAEAPVAKEPLQQGIASWYGPRFHGRRTASGTRFNMHGISVAHRTLPLLSYVKVTLAETGAYVIAQVTDRGPYAKGRIVDLSRGAAAAIGLLERGLAQVIVEPISDK